MQQFDIVIRARIVIHVLLVLVTVKGFGQPSPVDADDIAASLKMARYPADTTAPAVVLVDFGDVSVPYEGSRGFQQKYTRTTRIKILSVDGYDYATFAIPLYHAGSYKERLSDLTGVTYNLVEGSVEKTPLATDNIFSEEYDDHFDFVRFTMPAVHVGSVIEVSYTLTSGDLVHLESWEFQREIPVVWSEYRVHIPEFYNYNASRQGFLPFAEATHESTKASLTTDDRDPSGFGFVTGRNGFTVRYLINTNRWVVKDAPAFRLEPYTSSEANLLTRIRFELSSTKFPGDQEEKPFLGSWQQICKQLWTDDDFGAQVTGNPFFRKIGLDAIAGIDSSRQRIEALVKMVKATMTWDGQSRMYSRNLKKPWESRKGNSADINLALTALLSNCGFTAYPVVISTREHGILTEEIPELLQCNYLICAVNTEAGLLLLDATDPSLPYNVLPTRCLNGRGYLVNEYSGYWVALTSPVSRRTTAKAIVHLDSADMLSGSIDYTYEGYDASDERSTFARMGEAAYLHYIENRKHWTSDSAVVRHAQEVDQPFEIQHFVSLQEPVVRSGGTLYIDPIVALRTSDNPFRLEERQYPVDYTTPVASTFLLQLTVPEGYSVDELPKSQVYSLPRNDCRFLYNASVLGRQISLTCTLQINKSQFTPDEYAALRQFYSLVVAKEAEQIVFKQQ